MWPSMPNEMCELHGPFCHPFYFIDMHLFPTQRCVLNTSIILQACPHRLQSAILASPMGVIRLMDMLSEREVRWEVTMVNW